MHYYCSPYHRDHPVLHSFPTRRSSDLSPRHALKRITPSASNSRIAARSAATVSCKPFKASVARSEEHTSELQSRPHLVCRLLLEKKNKPRTFDTTEPASVLLTSNSVGQ